MKKAVLFVAMFNLLLSAPATAGQNHGHDHDHKSPYAGEEKREIKTLSEADLEALEHGGGWGLAKAAELNGMPGPLHLLEMREEISLSPEQVERIEQIYVRMKEQAVFLGKELIELERLLNSHFARRTINKSRLKKLLNNISTVTRDLRYVHLSAHLKTPDILTEEQLRLYNRLRGYETSEDPCENVPEGHDPETWRLHNNCG